MFDDGPQLFPWVEKMLSNGVYDSVEELCNARGLNYDDVFDYDSYAEREQAFEDRINGIDEPSTISLDLNADGTIGPIGRTSHSHSGHHSSAKHSGSGHHSHEHHSSHHDSASHDHSNYHHSHSHHDHHSHRSNDIGKVAASAAKDVRNFCKDNGTGMLMGAVILTPLIADISTKITKKKWLKYAKEHGID